MFSNIKSLAGLLALAVALIVSGCSSKKATTEAAPLAKATLKEHGQEVVIKVEQLKAGGIEIGVASEREMSQLIHCNGALEVPPQNFATVSSRIAGVVQSTALLQGSPVSKGQVLAVLESPEALKLQQSYLQTKARLKNLDQEYARQAELLKENVSAAKIFQQIESERDIQRVEFAGLNRQLRLLGFDPTSITDSTLTSIVRVYAPISGTVSQLNINIGKQVTLTDVLFEIVDTRHLHAELMVFEQDVPFLRVGQQVRFTLTNQPGAERAAKIHLINQVLDADRKLRVHAHLEKEDPKLLPGTFLSATIETGGLPVWALPEDALATNGTTTYAFAVENEESDPNATVFKAIPVTVGNREGGYAAVVFPAGTRVHELKFATKGAFTLLAVLTGGEEGGGHGH
jgi:membrane fusion protein, heavy metal efflux system